MSWIVLVHVVSAIVGVGPAFFLHVLLRKKQNIGELRVSMKLSGLLELFPKIGGTLAVVSGLLLVIMSDWAFKELWIWTSIIVYVLIQIVVIGFVAPRTKIIAAWLKAVKMSNDSVVPAEQQAWLVKANNLMYVASFLAIILFALMVLKPLL